MENFIRNGECFLNVEILNEATIIESDDNQIQRYNVMRHILSKNIGR